MMDPKHLQEVGRPFSEMFWKNNGKTVQQKPQNPIAEKQALYNKDPRPDKVSLAQGMVFNDKDRMRIYHSETNTWFDTIDEAGQAGSDMDGCDIFINKEGKIFHSPAVFVAQQRALERFKEEQFGADLKKNPAAYGTPTAPALQAAIAFDGEDIYGEGKYDFKKTISYQTIGMASGYKHLTLPVINSVRTSIGYPPIQNILMGTNFYGAYAAAFSEQEIYRYRYMDENGEFDLKSFKKAAENANPETTMVLFDISVGNNFVGTKRTKSDNENIAQILIDRQLYSEHDIAYPNFDPEFDLDWELYRILSEAGASHGVQSSRGKKDKYASRLSFHHVFLGTEDQKTNIFSHLVTENRNAFLAMPDSWMYLTEIARDPVLRASHKKDEQAFVAIVNASRKNLAQELGWNWMNNRSGMFDMVNISHDGAEKMGEEYGIYAVPSRNQNIVGKDKQPVEVTRIKHGLPAAKIQMVADALQNTIKKYPSERGKRNPDIIVAP